MGRLGRQILRGLREVSEVYGYKKEKLPWYKAAWEAFYFSKVYNIITEPYNIVRRFVNKCIKVYQFLPAVWRHEDWDSAYTLEFMHFLFKRMYKAVYVEGHHVENPNDKRRLLIAAELLKRMSNANKYDDAHYEYLEQKFGEIDYDFEEVVDNSSNRTYTTLVDKRERRLSGSDRILYKKMKSEVHKIEYHRYNQDMELFCKIFKKNCRKWWN